ncbi:MAG: phosphotransferase [Planctomycetaceae bacterium]|nr:phosphotransferase [Planctomycetaceae bacterium]
MLSDADRELVRRDPQITGLPFALDDQSTTEWITQIWDDIDCQSVTSTFIRYKPGRSCLVSFRAEQNGLPLSFAVKCFGHSAAEKWKRLQTHVKHRRGQGQPSIIHPSMSVIAFQRHDDPQLRSLRRLAYRHGERKLLRELLPNSPELWSARISELRYNPERRFVGKLLMTHGPVGVLKCYSKPRFDAVMRAGDHHFLQALGASTQLQAIVWPWVEGQTLGDLLRSGTATEQDIERTALALARLHAEPCTLHRTYTPHGQLNRIRSLTLNLDQLVPEFSARVCLLLPVMERQLMSQPERTSVIHGDFHADQVVLSDDQATLIDFDNLSIGCPQTDVASWIAHLEWLAVTGEIEPNSVDRCIKTFESAYRGASIDTHPAEITRHLAIARLLLIDRPFRLKLPDWPQKMHHLIDRIECDLLPSTRAPRKRPQWGLPNERSSQPISPDPAMPMLSEALDPRAMTEHLRIASPALSEEFGEFVVESIRIVKHKPGRRCLIEYALTSSRRSRIARRRSILGKVRAKGVDKHSYAIQQSLWNAGFDDLASDGISVPRTLGTIPDLHMWLQEKVTGQVVTEVVSRADGLSLAPRIAEALQKLHETDVTTSRCWSFDDELAILNKSLPAVAEQQPALSGTIHEILERCHDAVAAISDHPTCGIHRDFHPDQVLVDGDRIWLVDLDLYCQGHPAIDIGNFCGHLLESAVRNEHDCSILNEFEEVFRHDMVMQLPTLNADDIHHCTTLTLARLITLSSHYPTRRAFTPRIVTATRHFLQRRTTPSCLQ